MSTLKTLRDLLHKSLLEAMSPSFRAEVMKGKAKSKGYSDEESEWFGNEMGKVRKERLGKVVVGRKKQRGMSEARGDTLARRLSRLGDEGYQGRHSTTEEGGERAERAMNSPKGSQQRKLAVKIARANKPRPDEQANPKLVLKLKDRRNKRKNKGRREEDKVEENKTTLPAPRTEGSRSKAKRKDARNNYQIGKGLLTGKSGQGSLAVMLKIGREANQPNPR
jgi:hypothetical protein